MQLPYPASGPATSCLPLHCLVHLPTTMLPTFDSCCSASVQCMTPHLSHTSTLPSSPQKRLLYTLSKDSLESRELQPPKQAVRGPPFPQIASPLAGPLPQSSGHAPFRIRERSTCGRAASSSVPPEIDPACVECTMLIDVGAFCPLLRGMSISKSKTYLDWSYGKPSALCSALMLFSIHTATCSALFQSGRGCDRSHSGPCSCNFGNLIV